jgi:hypothetical protein
MKLPALLMVAANNAWSYASASHASLFDPAAMPRGIFMLYLKLKRGKFKGNDNSATQPVDGL